MGSGTEGPEGPDRPARVRADLATVYREHHAYVWRCLYHLGIRRPWIDDAAQDVFMVVHDRLADFDGRTALRNWLYGIARRIASDYRRGRRRGGPRLRAVPDAASATAGNAGADLERRAEAGDLVEHFLGTLDDGKRQVFVLAEVEGMSGPEIAATLGLNVNTVYARLRAVRLRFEEVVAEREDSGEHRWTS